MTTCPKCKQSKTSETGWFKYINDQIRGERVGHCKNGHKWLICKYTTKKQNKGSHND